MRILNVWPEPVGENGPDIQLKAVLEFPNNERKVLWFRTPIREAPQPVTNADSFAIAAIFSAMHHADVMKVHGNVSPSLLNNLAEFQYAWAAWYPALYHVTDLQAEVEVEEPPASNAKAVMSFSGGLDSSFTAWRHTGGRNNFRLRTELAAGLMVHGFDIPVTESAVFARAVENSRAMLGSIGIPTLTVATNFREIKENWEHAHGAGLAACLHLFKRSYGACVIASSHTYDTLRAGWGSNPVTDALLASANFPIIHDGCGFWRREKARAVAAWPQGMEHLRVCWEGPEKDRNCGVCLRCIGTAICFAIEGAPIPPPIPIADLAGSIRTLTKSSLSPVAVQRLAELLAAAKSNNVREAPWVRALEQLVAKKQITPLGRFLRGNMPFGGPLRRLKRQFVK